MLLKMKQINLNTKFFPFIVNFYFLYAIKKFKIEHEQRIELPEDKHINRVVYTIPLSKELSEKYNREYVLVVNLDNKDFNCCAACDIDNEEIFEHIRKTVYA